MTPPQPSHFVAVAAEAFAEHLMRFLQNDESIGVDLTDEIFELRHLLAADGTEEHRNSRRDRRAW